MIKTLRHLCTRHRVTKHSLTSVYGEDSFTTPLSSSEPSTTNSIEMEVLQSEEDIFDSIKEIPTLGVLNNSPNGRDKKAIICSIHQPSSEVFELFTHIILMDAGRVIYQGSTDRAFQFFTK